MRANRLSGHILPSEGRLWVDGRLVAEGRGQCSCGATSDVLPSANARKKWHRDEHKERVREHGFDDRAVYPATAEQVAALIADLEADIADQGRTRAADADDVAIGRLIGMKDALRMVRQHLTPKGTT